jgi:hypothetical protein
MIANGQREQLHIFIIATFSISGLIPNFGFYAQG